MLFKSWLFAIPQLVIVARTTGGTRAAWTGGHGETFSLLGRVLLVAAIILLFTGVYRLGLFNLIMGAHRWMYRVFACTALMREGYAPFPPRPRRAREVGDSEQNDGRHLSRGGHSAAHSSPLTRAGAGW